MRPDDADPARDRRRREDVEDARATRSASPTRPRRCSARRCASPTRRWPTWFELLAIPRPPAGTSPRDAKRALARGIIERFHGADAAAAAQAAFDRVFIEHEIPEDVAEAAVARADGMVHLPAALAEAFGISRSEARRLLAQGGVRVDGEPLPGDELDVPGARLDGLVVQVGRRQFRRLRVAA